MSKIKGVKFETDTKLHFTACHQIPSRSFFWKGKQFPLCARCSGINLGYLTLPLFIFGIMEIGLVWSIILMLPTYIDGLVQAYMNVKSTNSRRFVTGIISGVGTMSLVSIFGKFIGNQILLFIN